MFPWWQPFGWRREKTYGDWRKVSQCDDEKCGAWDLRAGWCCRICKYPTSYFWRRRVTMDMLVRVLWWDTRTQESWYAETDFYDE